MAQTLLRRGFTLPEDAWAFLDPDRYTPASPSELPGLEQAAWRLEAAIRSGEGILVWGDFDVDGQTATALLVSALHDLGAKVGYHIPVRAVESHGMNLDALRSFLGQGVEEVDLSTSASGGTIPISLVLTCDTGINAHEAVAYAQERGVDVVITDHHELPPELPPAYAVVNPKMLPEGHKLRGLPGVGVAYKLAEELYIRASRELEIEQYHDLAALGIVADVAPVTGESRYLLQRGLAQLRKPKRAGLQAIYERAELDPTWLTEEHVGFALAPRLNALGRLSDANPAVELFTTQDMGKARLLALQLEGLNSHRQLLTNQVLKGAFAQIEKDRSLLEGPVLVLAHPAWEAGVIGIVASRLVEIYRKPAILIAAPKDGIGRGSARSVEDAMGSCLVDITQAIASQAKLLLGYGGHAMAAGFSIPVEKIPEFRRGLALAVAQMVEEQMKEGRIPSTPTLAIDAYLDWGEISMDLALDLERLAPFGSGNPALVLASRNMRLTGYSTVGREKEHLLLTVENESGLARRVIWWNGSDYQETDALPQESFDLAYTLRASTFRGQRDLQLEWLDSRPPESGIIQVKASVEVMDYRRQAYPLAVLQRLAQDPLLDPLQVWAEGKKEADFHFDEVAWRTRYDLTPCKTLVIWTAPPGRAELMKAMEISRPEKVALFGIDPGNHEPQAFVERLAGMVKYAVSKYEGRMRMANVAAALAQREATIRKGLEWLEAKGEISIQIEGGGRGSLEEEIVINVGGSLDADRSGKVLEELKALLEETRAFRAWFRRAEKVV